MKLNEAHILLITATNFNQYLENLNSEAQFSTFKEQHWQYRWHKKIPTSELIEAPEVKQSENITANHAFLQWVSDIKNAITSATKPVLFIGHSYGVCAALTAISDLIPNIKQQIKGAFFVSPALFESEDNISTIQMSKLPFPSFLISSTNDTMLEHIKAKDLATNLGSFFLDAGESGHIDATTGHGPWPEGLLILSQFLAKL